MGFTVFRIFLRNMPPTFYALQEDIKFDTLLEYRERIINETQSILTDNHKQLLLSFMEKNPEWDHLPFNNLVDFPAIKWKLGFFAYPP